MLPLSRKENQIEIYQSEDGSLQLPVEIQAESVWLSAAQLVALFGRDKSVISRHISALFKEGELLRDSVVANFATTAEDGKTYRVDHYNLDVIISIGYRVKSQQGVRFRQWATQRLKEHLTRGYKCFDFQASKKAFGDSIIPAISLSTHAAFASVFSQQVLEFL